MQHSLYFLKLLPHSLCASPYSRTQVSQTESILLKGQFLKKTIPSPSKQHTELANLWGHSHIPKIVVFLEAREMTNSLTISNSRRWGSPQPLTLPFGLMLLPRLKMPQYSQNTSSDHWNSSIYSMRGNCCMIYKVIPKKPQNLVFSKYHLAMLMTSWQFWLVQHGSLVILSVLFSPFTAKPN